MPKLGAMELGIILLIILMVFGVGKLPQVGASLGKAIRGFKQGASGEGEQDTKAAVAAEEEEERATVTKSKAKKRVAKKHAEAKAGV
jgi:sec-independent protein translocase protein TatA